MYSCLPFNSRTVNVQSPTIGQQSKKELHAISALSLHYWMNRSFLFSVAGIHICVRMLQLMDESLNTNRQIEKCCNTVQSENSSRAYLHTAWIVKILCSTSSMQPPLCKTSSYVSCFMLQYFIEHSGIRHAPLKQNSVEISLLFVHRIMVGMLMWYKGWQTFIIIMESLALKGKNPSCM